MNDYDIYKKVCAQLCLYDRRYELWQMKAVNETSSYIVIHLQANIFPTRSAVNTILYNDSRTQFNTTMPNKEHRWIT